MQIVAGKKLPTITAEGIYGFFAEYRFLSNYHICTVHHDGLVFQSSEAAFQAAKCLDLQTRRTFCSMEPAQSKFAGKRVALRDDWDWVRDDIMLDILVDKFTRHPHLRDKLLQTGDLYLEETNDWRDIYWGVYNKIGENKLGKTLMAIRTALK